jgi:WD40-like Beta Propeller Repeat
MSIANLSHARRAPARPDVSSAGDARRAMLAALSLALAIVAWGALLPLAASAETCANEQIRSEQGSLRLPECRAYELVSPVDKGGTFPSGGLVASDEGSRVGFGAGWMPGAKSFAGGGAVNPYIAQRGASGWTTTALDPPPAYIQAGANIGYEEFAPGITGVLWYAATQQQRSAEAGGFFVAGLDGSFTPASPLLNPQVVSQGLTNLDYVGASADLSNIVLEHAGTKLQPSDPNVEGGRSTLWDVVGANTPNPTISIVNRDVPGSPPGGGVCGAILGGREINEFGSIRGAISDDGSVIYFATHPNCSDQSGGYRLFARVNGTTTVAVSASQCHRVAPAPPCEDASGDDWFEGASADGTRAYFTTTRQLVDGDTDSEPDLYEYDSSPAAGQPNLVEVSAGSSPAGFEGVEAISTDGSHVYFVAQGVLTGADRVTGRGPEESEPQAGGNNLYVYEHDAAYPSGRITFVATLAPDEVDPNVGLPPWSNACGCSRSRVGSRGAETAPAQGDHADGHVLLFESFAQLVSADKDASRDMYRYDADTDSLTGVTTGSSAAQNVPALSVTSEGYSGPAVVERGRQMSEDGQAVVFEAPDSPIGGDTVGTHVYEWRDGVVSLISLPAGNEAQSPTVSASGDDLFFTTDAKLLPEDTDLSPDIYDARIGGGFPAALTLAAPCQGESCRGGLSAPPVFAPPGSTPFESGGNFSPPTTQPAVKPKPKPKPLTRAQKLAKALKACKKRAQRKRAGCEKQAKKRYGRSK